MTESRNPFTVLAAALALAAAAALAMPAEAGWLGRGLAVGGAASSLHKNFDELVDKTGDMIKAAIDGDEARAGVLEEEISLTPFKIAVDAFPVGAAAAKAVGWIKDTKERTQAAAERIREITAPEIRGNAALAVSPGRADIFRRSGIVAVAAPRPGNSAAVQATAPEPKSTVTHWDIVAYGLSCLKTTRHVPTDSAEYRERRAAAEQRMAKHGTVVCEEDEAEQEGGQAQAAADDSQGKDTEAKVEADAEEREAALGLDRGSRTQIQSCLRHLGFDPGAADGIFGPKTRAAIRSWQGSEDLIASGYFEGGQPGQILRPCEAIVEREESEDALLSAIADREAENERKRRIEREAAARAAREEARAAREEQARVERQARAERRREREREREARRAERQREYDDSQDRSAEFLNIMLGIAGALNEGMLGDGGDQGGRVWCSCPTAPELAYWGHVDSSGRVFCDCGVFDYEN